MPWTDRQQHGRVRGKKTGFIWQSSGSFFYACEDGEVLWHNPVGRLSDSQEEAERVGEQDVDTSISFWCRIASLASGSLLARDSQTVPSSGPVSICGKGRAAEALWPEQQPGLDSNFTFFHFGRAKPQRQLKTLISRATMHLDILKMQSSQQEVGAPMHQGGNQNN